jgi:PKD repeat protein
MQRKSAPTSGFIHLRNLFGLLLCLSGISLGMLSYAGAATRKATTRTGSDISFRAAHSGAAPIVPAAGPAPGTGTLSPANPKLTYVDSVGPVPNATGEGVTGAPICAANGVDCSSYALTLDPSIFVANGAYDPSRTNIVIQIAWSPSVIQYGSFVEDKNGNVVASNTAGIDPETITIAVGTPNLQANGPYTIVTTLEIGSPGTGYNGTVTLQTSAAGGIQGAGPVPRYQIYEAPSTAANMAGEPSIGVDWNPNVPGLKQIGAGNTAHGPTQLNTGGMTMFTATFNEYQVAFDDCSSPAINSWTDVSFIAQQITTLDAIGFTDHFSSAALGTSYPPPQTPGRTFHGQLTAGDSNTSYTDDDGATHTPSQGGGVPQGPDHETIGAGPYNPNSTPPPPPHPTYSNAVYYCTQNVAPEAECSRSDDGGLTFGPGIPIYQNPQACTGSIHGHVKVASDGTVYVPNYSCAIQGVGNQGVAMSTDNGITWTENNVPGSGSPKPGLVDPSVGISLNDVAKPSGQTTNTIYFGYIDSDGSPKIAVSHDRGTHWSTPQNVGGAFNIANSTFPVVVAGDDNRAAFGFLGTITPGDSSLDPNFPGVWHLYIATTYDGGNTYSTIDATPNDPIQVGPICNGGTTCSTKRNLLDFNGFDVDAEGRGLLGLSDGCVNCTNSSSSADSNAAQGMVARQSGGLRLFSHFDPVEPAAPARPQAISAVQIDAHTVQVSWLEPDNGGSPITAYNIYRGTSSGAETLLATVPNDPLNVHTKFVDTTAVVNNTTPNYFYHVTAVNVKGESGFCQELSLTPPVLSGSPCAAPYLTVDGPGTASATDPTMGELSIQNVNIGEPFTSCTDNSITFVMKVQTLDPASTGSAVLPSNTEWQILFNVLDTNGNPETLYVELDTFTPLASSANPEFGYGRRDPRTGGSGTLDTTTCSNSTTSTCPGLTGTFNKDGTITIKLNVGTALSFAAPAATTGTAFTWDGSMAGTKLSSVTGNTYLFVGTGAGLLETVQTTTGGSYTRVGNVFCAAQPPVAELSATPSTGNAPLNVTFNAGASTDPLSCATISSYTLDFGDGSAPVTQNTPTFSHTYTTPGAYPARLTVGDTARQTSANLAQQVITVTSAGSPQLSGAVSRMTHGTAGTFEINLPLTAPNGIECRTGGANGNHQIVFTFANNLVSVDSATVTSGAATVSSSAPGPNANQYTVNLTGVTNAQSVTIALVNAHDSTGAIGNVSVTAGFLLGDTTANGAVNSSDIAQTQSQSGQTVTNNNFREDVTANGAINSSDIATVQAQSGTALP